MAKPKKKSRKKSGKKSRRKLPKRKTKPKAKPKKRPRRKPRKSKKRGDTKKIFERRTELPEAEQEPPPGFDIDLGQLSQEQAFAVIEARLQDTRVRLPEGISGFVSVVPNADFSIDGEIYIDVPPGQTTQDTEWILYEAFTNLAVSGFKYWVSMGARYIVETDDERYKRNKGMTQVETNYQRAIRPNIAEEHVILRRKIMEGMDKRFGEQAHSIFIRLHWNPQDQQPRR